MFTSIRKFFKSPASCTARKRRWYFRHCMLTESCRMFWPDIQVRSHQVWPGNRFTNSIWAVPEFVKPCVGLVEKSSYQIKILQNNADAYTVVKFNCISAAWYTHFTTKYNLSSSIWLSWPCKAVSSQPIKCILNNREQRNLHLLYRYFRDTGCHPQFKCLSCLTIVTDLYVNKVM